MLREVHQLRKHTAKKLCSVLRVSALTCTLKTEYLNSKKKPRIIEINENIAKRPREFERTNLQGQVKKG
ncbi:hypothetical protein PF586_10640, partial [Lactobacillus delbrueckii]